MMCFDVLLFGSNLFGTLCASYTCMSISSAKLGKPFIIISNKFSISCSSSSPSGTIMIWIFALLEMSQVFLSFSSFFKILVLSGLVECLFLPYVPNPGFLPFSLVPCGFFFILLSVTFISSLMLLPYSMSSLSILITSALNSASDRLVISILFSFFFWSFVLFFHLSHVSLSPQFVSLPVFVSVY